MAKMLRKLNDYVVYFKSQHTSYHITEWQHLGSSDKKKYYCRAGRADPVLHYTSIINQNLSTGIFGVVYVDIKQPDEFKSIHAVVRWMHKNIADNEAKKVEDLNG